MEIVRLDKKDREILFHLDNNSRQSFSDLGKKVRLKKETVFQRVKRLQEKGILEQFQTIINPHKLGYQNYRLLIKLKRVDKKKTEEIINFFINSKFTGWVVKCEGNWDLAIWYQIKDLYDFKIEYEIFKYKFSNFVSREKLSIFTDVMRYSKSFLLDRKNNHKIIMSLSGEKISLTQSDRELLKVLANNSRTSLVELSENLNLSTKTIMKRIKYLEKNKIILGYSIRLNSSKIGFPHFKLHIKLDDLNQEIIKKIEGVIYLNKNMTWLNKSISGFDLDIDVNIESSEELSKLLEELKHLFKKNIDNYEILFYKKEYKQRFL